MKSSPRPMRFNPERDPIILGKIHELDGMAGARQIMRFRDKDGNRIFQSFRTTRDRLSKLVQNDYLARLDRQQRAAHSDMVFWLTEKGAEVVAALHGQELSTFRYRKRPRSGLIEHDLALNDFYLDIEEACFELDDFSLDEFVPSGHFWAYPDEVEYRDEQGKEIKRRIRPDGYYVIRHFNETDGQWYRHRLMLELDRATEDNLRFAREKVIPYVSYLYSNKYEKRFGANSGRVLVVTSGLRRMRNMLRQTAAAAGRDTPLFFFTTMDQVNTALLTAPIWWRGGEEHPRPLFEDS